MSSIGKLMKQATRMQEKIERVQSEIADKTVEATSGGGAVKVTAKCDGSLASIKIDPAAVNPADVSLLEDMVLAAANNALAQAKKISDAEMGKVTQGFNLPGMM
ncbi:MAG: nucleoid-associated protein [Pedosphaera sp.]|nr:YbaB/EbfC family nucleoid-associated protein [Pedosphaera sp.]PHX95734.1 MAG: nucleoid-associated protein [Pedosphaera sp.]